MFKSSGCGKAFTATSRRKQLLSGSEAEIFGLFMDFDADQQLLGNEGQKEPRFSDVLMMYV
jgi:hypothetical protein